MPLSLPRLTCLALLFPTGLAAETLPANHAERMKLGMTLFRDSIRPVLIAECLKCHGDEKVRSGLDLSSRERLLAGGESGEVVDLANPGNSFLLGLMRHEEEPTMPPKKDRLDESVVLKFQRWIELGAPYDKPLLEKKGDTPREMRVTDSDRDFWSFRPLASKEPPGIESPWLRNDIDRFVLSRLQEHQLNPNPPASDRDRIRRTYLDVIGLPPSPEQMDAALGMSHESLVDDLLASPHYGERWARHWLDAARFAESHGFEQDYDRKFAYHYRDFVIKALNANLPWDDFVRWQIAGDEIAPDDPLALMATGFLGAGVFPTQLTEKEFESARYDELDDMAATIGNAMLGLTIGCARCHDHKFDPIPVKDYYRFVSTFTSTIRSEIDIELEPERYRNNLGEWMAEHARHVSALEAHRSNPATRAAFEAWLKSGAPADLAKGDWTVLEIDEATSSDKATTLTRQPDGALLASGRTPAQETYTVTATTGSEAIRFIRIEALTHDSMKRKGPGRAGNGNFALSHLELLAAPAGGDQKANRVKLGSARATHEQNPKNLSVASAIDEDPRGTGWAVDAGGIGKDQAAVFALAPPLENATGSALEFKLTFANNGQHSLGRFRLSVSENADPPVVVGKGSSEALDQAIAAWKNGSLETAHRETLFPRFARGNPEWSRLEAAVATSLSGKPQPETTKVQVSSEGFPPTKHHADGRGFPHFYPQTHLLNRGDPNQKQEVMQSGYLEVLMRNGKTSADWKRTPPPDWKRTSYRRAGLADWITDVENGAGNLLARVAANRLWYHHFGQGIVATPNDFGLQGTLPTHPDLLEFLAQRLIDSGWDLKALHRDMLLSATWRQSSETDSARAQIDPENQWFWRYPSRRLEAEIVRDAMLATSGQLDPTMFGPGTLDPRHQRRSLYFMIKRSRLVPMMQVFDQPEPLTSQGRRPSTTIAPQALMMMNNPQVVKWAADLAAGIEPDNPDEAISEIYSRILGRPPSPSELARSRDFFDAQSTSYGESDEAKSRTLALADLSQALFGLNEFLYLP